MQIRRRDDLLFTDLGWVRIRDHFIATVGPTSGRGRGYGDLLVLADAEIAPRSSFPFHGHRDMEIVSVVLRGVLTHREPGGEQLIPEGGIQVMSAGTGAVHAEANFGDVPVRVLQIWLRPRHAGGAYRHEIAGPPALGPRFTTVTPPELRQDAAVAMARLAPGESSELDVPPGRAAYLFLAGGAAPVGEALVGADGGAVLQAGAHTINALEPVTLVAIHIRAPEGASNA